MAVRLSTQLGTAQLGLAQLGQFTSGGPPFGSIDASAKSPQPAIATPLHTGGAISGPGGSISGAARSPQGATATALSAGARVVLGLSIDGSNRRPVQAVATPLRAGAAIAGPPSRRHRGSAWWNWQPGELALELIEQALSQDLSEQSDLEPFDRGFAKKRTEG